MSDGYDENDVGGVGGEGACGGAGVTAPTTRFLLRRQPFVGRGVRRAGLDAEALLAELAPRTEADGARPEACRRSALVDFIIARLHDPLREELTRLEGMARKVERVHRDKPTCPSVWPRTSRDDDAASPSAWGRKSGALPDDPRRLGARAHMPIKMMMQRARGPRRQRPAAERMLTADLAAPADACGAWRLCDGLRELELDLMRHVHLENDSLFRRS